MKAKRILLAALAALSLTACDPGFDVALYLVNDLDEPVLYLKNSSSEYYNGMFLADTTILQSGDTARIFYDGGTGIADGFFEHCPMAILQDTLLFADGSKICYCIEDTASYGKNPYTSLEIFYSNPYASTTNVGGDYASCVAYYHLDTADLANAHRQ